MNRLVTTLHLLCWIIVAGYFVAFIGYGFYFQRVSPNLWCGKTATDPLSFLLNCAAPLAGFATGTLASLWFRRELRVFSPLWAGLLSATATIGLSAHGLFLSRTIFPGHPFSEFVWWLGPFGKLF